MVVEGRISLREERAAQVICENICPADEFSGRKSVSENSVKKENPQTASKYHGLHLLLPDDRGEVYERVKNLLEIFEGTTPVYFKFQSSGKRVLAPRSLWVDLNKPLTDELLRILGEKGVFVLK